MRDLAHESGLAKATLYHHFQDKREIMLHVLRREMRLVSNAIAQAAAMPGDLSTRLREVIVAYFTLTEDRGMLLLSTLREAGGMETEFCDLVRSYGDEMQRPIVELLTEAISKQIVRPIDPALTAMTFIGIMQVFASRYLLMRDIALDAQAVNFVLDFMLNALASSQMPRQDTTVIQTLSPT
jgi:AcrR family transcriptional regulator